MTAIFIQLTRDLYVIRLKHFSASSLFEIYDTRQPQPPPQALRFSQGRGERLVMSRRGPWEGYRRQAKHVSPDVSFPPSLARVEYQNTRNKPSKISKITLELV